MTSYAVVQNHVYFGYAKAASEIGQLYDVYRAPSAIAPISSGNLIGQQYVSQNVEWTYTKANKYGNAVWQLLVDGRVVQLFDYLIGPGAPNTPQVTFFICAMEPILPINGVQCNRTVTITRPLQSLTPGANPYGGYDGTTVTTLATGLPISILQWNRVGPNPFKLPLDTKVPSYNILMPALPGFDVRIGDLIDDDLGVRTAITHVEYTELGIRCLSISVQS